MSRSVPSGPDDGGGTAARRALVRRPSPRLADGLVTHLERQPVDVDLALRQWEAYVGALRAEGWETVEVEPAPDCPDSAFVEDTVVVYGDLAVISRPGADERRPETPGTEAALRDLGYRIAHIEAPGTLDGGDVLMSPQRWISAAARPSGTHSAASSSVAGTPSRLPPPPGGARTGESLATPTSAADGSHAGTVWVGLNSGPGGRTNQAGIDQLATHLAPLGAEVVAVPLSKALHLKSAVTALPDGTVVGWDPVVDDAAVWPRYEAVPEEPGAHVVLLDDRTVLMSTAAPATRAAYEARGLRCVVVDISEFEKLEGCVTCLSVRLRHALT